MRRRVENVLPWGGGDGVNEESPLPLRKRSLSVGQGGFVPTFTYPAARRRYCSCGFGKQSVGFFGFPSGSVQLVHGTFVTLRTYPQRWT